MKQEKQRKKLPSIFDSFVVDLRSALNLKTKNKFYLNKNNNLSYVNNLNDRLVEELELFCIWAIRDDVGHSK
jgi:hypothetical protein